MRWSAANRRDKVALHSGEDVGIRVDGEQHRLRHAGYPGPDVFAPPVGRGGCTNVSSA